MTNGETGIRPIVQKNLGSNAVQSKERPGIATLHPFGVYGQDARNRNARRS